MQKCNEVVSIISIDDYKIEVIRDDDKFDKVSLWIMRSGINIKMKIADMSLNANEDTMVRWLKDTIDKNFEMKKFDYECLIHEGFSAGLVDAR